MLTFDARQMAAFQGRREADFVAEALRRLARRFPDWAAATPEAEREALARAVLAFAREHGIRSAGPIRHLMRLKLVHDFPVPPTPYQVLRLRQPGLSERRRVEAFEAALKDPAPPEPVRLPSTPSGAD